MSATPSPRYRPLDERSLPGFLAGIPAAADRLGGRPAEWSALEVGDGNLNLVFLVEGPGGSVCVKQALPYLRLVGPGWPLPLSRAFFEHEALVEQGQHAPGRVPAVLHFEADLALIVMERLSPHVIMRKGLIAGTRYPHFAAHLSDFIAATLFHTSDLALGAAQKRARVATFCGNDVLCKITEDLIFTEPYVVAERNRWTSPELDADAAALRADFELKAHVSELKRLFLGSAEALLHGDLHTGSIMVTQTDTRVIDPEFAFYGPMGFDIGAVIANLLLAYFSQEGHATAADSRDAYRAWILEQIAAVWNGFAEKFLGHWRRAADGDGVPARMFEGNPSALAVVQREWMTRILRDSVGFAGAKMIRRIVGLAHVEDLESIADRSRRAAAERRALRLARELIVTRTSFQTIDQLVAAASR